MRLQELEQELASVTSLGPVTFADIDGTHRNHTSPDSASPDHNVDIIDVVHDSRTATPGALFCAVPGLTVDGHDFVDTAIARGAVAVLVQHSVQTDRPQIVTENVRRSMAHAAAIVHGHPSRSLAVFGITGTNGKTTTTQLLQSIVTSAGRACAVIGTLGGTHTTPESPDLQRQFRSFVDNGGDVIALEVSSHALDQGRVDATHFEVAAFSNLTPDHLDYHRTMDAYFEAKKQLFDGRARAELINVDDPWGERLADERPGAVRVSVADISVDHESLAGTRFTWRGQETWVPLPGQMNVANALMAAEAALLLGLSEAQIVVGLATADSVPGRMQTVGATNDAQPTVVVDYSHTPDSIRLALATLRAVAPAARLSIVFGCGGDRDRQKRPMMAAAAEAGADRVYITSDNPRSEDPMAIINDAVHGFRAPEAVVIEPDRKAAIERAIIDAAAGDVVLIAGKGHEKTQTIGTDVFPFDDVRVASTVLEAANT